VFNLTDGHLLLSVALFDQFNRRTLSIDKNQLIYTVDHWDIEFMGRTLIIRAGHGDVFIDMTFDPPNIVRFNRGRILYNGVEILLAKDYAWLSNAQAIISGNYFEGSFGVVIGTQDLPAPGALRISNVNRYLGKTPRAGHMAARRAIVEAGRRQREMELRRQGLSALRSR
jgi:hypothetical protein